MSCESWLVVVAVVQDRVVAAATAAAERLQAAFDTAIPQSSRGNPGTEKLTCFGLTVR
jgi:hypothetical protein